MNTASAFKVRKPLEALWTLVLQILPCFALYFLVELFAYLSIQPESPFVLVFGVLWGGVLSCICMLLPRKAGRIFFGISYFVSALWAIVQSGYYRVFGKMMWLSTIGLATEGAGFIGDILVMFSLLWWIGAIMLIGLGVVYLIFYPRTLARFSIRLLLIPAAAICIIGMFLAPRWVFRKDANIWGTHSEYARSSSYRAKYETMYDTTSVYSICGIYQMTAKDIWHHYIYPLTPAYNLECRQTAMQLDQYFSYRNVPQSNKMTGLFSGKNVVLVLMESIDDWMITPEDTPTLCRLLDEGISFTSFYTPGYGSARTLNSEFCMNTGIFLPTTGTFVFDYVTNSFNQSIASQMTQNGYTAEVFHYNDPSFYSRGVFEPAMGYHAYNCYADYEDDAKRLFDDQLLFDIPEISELFFREGKTLNTIITRSAHLSYVYREVLSNYGLHQYPQYKGMYASEEEDCARLKAKLVDDMFARLLKELEAHGQLENTVIIGMTDHYTYGYKNMDELYSHSGVDQDILLEKTPCFIWSRTGPAMDVSKTLNTADLLPTVLNIMGIPSPYRYLGEDAFDERYPGYAIFPNGDWISQGVLCENGSDITLLGGVEPTQDQIRRMNVISSEFIAASNLLLRADYYKAPRNGS